MRKILVTGASGFLGKYVVAAALKQGYRVQAVIRPMTDETKLSWYKHPNLELVRLDLRSKQKLVEALHTTDAVIHLAAVKSGDFYDQFAGTVIATENLLDAMSQTQVKRLIAISTFSVYDYQAMKSGETLTEDSPLEKSPLNRDEYAQTKLIQEDLIHKFEAEYSADVTIIRPGMIYGRECLWHALLGAEMGQTRWLKIGGTATMPMTYVENCAEAIISAVLSQASVGKIINVVDDGLPTQNEYIQSLQKRMDPHPKFIPISWPIMKGVSQIAWWVRQVPLRGKARLPGILVPAKLYARFNPLKYSNSCAKEYLNWQPRYTFEQSLDRCFSQEDLTAVDSNPQEIVTV
jgi:nucleoside-diphosphate-sugar epimerase